MHVVQLCTHTTPAPPAIIAGTPVVYHEHYALYIAATAVAMYAHAVHVHVYNIIIMYVHICMHIILHVHYTDTIHII